MVGLLLLKQLKNFSDEDTVYQVKQNPYYQVFCGFTEFSRELPRDSTELVKFRNRIGKEGVEEIFKMSVALHGKQALENTRKLRNTYYSIKKSPLQHPTPLNP